MSTATVFAFRLPSPPDAADDRFNAHLLNVTFGSVPEAIAAAREELPAGTWALARWSPLYGE